MALILPLFSSPYDVYLKDTGSVLHSGYNQPMLLYFHKFSVWSMQKLNK